MKYLITLVAVAVLLLAPGATSEIFAAEGPGEVLAVEAVDELTLDTLVETGSAAQFQDSHNYENSADFAPRQAGLGTFVDINHYSPLQEELAAVSLLTGHRLVIMTPLRV